MSLTTVNLSARGNGEIKHCKPCHWWAGREALALAALACMLASAQLRAAEPAAASAPARAALTVNLTTPQRADWPVPLAAAGSIAPWQEAFVSADGAGGRLVAVEAQVGDKVRRGQLLAQLATETVAAELAQSRAGLAEARAVLTEAAANAQRARELAPTGVISAQQAQQAYTAEATGRARVETAVAKVQADELRLSQTKVLAPDDGVISARSAVIGGFAGTGQELFRLIRRERLEWRAELPSAELSRIKPGLRATLTTPSGETVQGTVRQVAPTVDGQSRMGLVYVDLPAASAARAGMFARGEFSLGQSASLSLPQSALVLRDGFQWVMRLGADGRVVATKVQVGRRQGNRVELLGGLAADAKVVASGGAFLADGDLVKVVDQPVAASSSASVSAAASR